MLRTVYFVSSLVLLAVRELRKAGAKPGLAYESPKRADVPPSSAKVALERSIGLLERTSGQSFGNSGCVARHAQNVVARRKPRPKRQAPRSNRLQKMIAPLHAPGGPFHDHTRRQEAEELRFVRPDVAVAVVRTFDIRRAGVPPTTGEETRGLIIMSKEGGRWKLNALENTKIQATVNGQR